jgi:hypothetical protein
MIAEKIAEDLKFGKQKTISKNLQKLDWQKRKELGNQY